jgi:hypothetical protein
MASRARAPHAEETREGDVYRTLLDELVLTRQRLGGVLDMLTQDAIPATTPYPTRREGAGGRP